MAQPSATSPKPLVLAVVVARRGDDLTAVLETIEAQVYAADEVVVIADRRPVMPSDMTPPKVARLLSDALEAATTPADYLWMIDARTTARPDALSALVEAAENLEASVVGSKVLDRSEPDQLVSVGGPTDVFGYPYTGLESGEIDQEQFDVIRDVAFLEPASLLVRRDLAEGLGGLDRAIPYLSFGLDICQRARVVGGRVIVTPASEVFGERTGPQRADTWREQAGRIRVILKTYSLLTLFWVLPSLFLIGLIKWVYRLSKGRWSAPLDWVRAWVWNLLHLASTWAERGRAPSTSLESDAELFRYQVRGSVELRDVAAELGPFLGTTTDEERAEGDGRSGFWQRPDVISAVVAMVLVAVITRSILSEGLPSVGFVLPLTDSAWDLLRAYAGGWHAGGLGSPQPMHPSVGATSVLRLLLGSGAARLVTVGSIGFGLAGMLVLGARMGLSRGARLAAGTVFVAGFPTLFLAGEAYWPGLLALGGLPWALAGVVGSVPASGVVWITRLSRVALATVWSAVFVPFSVVIPALVGLMWGVTRRQARPVLIGSVGSLVALPVLFPWAGLHGLFGEGLPFHPEPSWWVFAPVLVAVAAVVMVARDPTLRVALCGSLIGAGGYLVARSGSLGAGQEVTAAGLLAVAVGVAMVVGAAVDAPASLVPDDAVGRSATAHVARVAALLVVLSALVAVPAGRAGLPDDRFGFLAFAESRGGESGPDRILMVGPASSLPGSYRTLPDGTPYRLISGVLDYSQAWLSAPRLGDEALEETLREIADGGELRPGRRLAEFGIGWVVARGPNPLYSALSAQLDMRPLAGLYVGESSTVWENDHPAPRAVTDSGFVWSWRVGGYSGTPDDGLVRIAENPDHRWGPGNWQQDDWANRVSAASGSAGFGGVDALRLQVWIVVAWVSALLVTAVLASGLRIGSRHR